MGAKEILAYRDRAVMSVRQFIELWLDEHLDDEPHHAAELLADLIEAERASIEIPDNDVRFDWLVEEVAEARNNLQRKTIAELREMVRQRSGIEAAPDTLLNREGLVTAFAQFTYQAPRFLYPPDSSIPAGHADSHQGSSGNGAGEELPYGHSEDFSMVWWYGARYSFSPKQAFVVELLWREFENHGLGLTQRTIGGLLEDRYGKPKIGDFRLRDLFKISPNSARMHPAWETMIQKVSKGTFALRPPKGTE